MLAAVEVLISISEPLASVVNFVVELNSPINMSVFCSCAVCTLCVSV